jgi:hypothetical protein
MRDGWPGLTPYSPTAALAMQESGSGSGSQAEGSGENNGKAASEDGAKPLAGKDLAGANGAGANDGGTNGAKNTCVESIVGSAPRLSRLGLGVVNEKESMPPPPIPTNASTTHRKVNPAGAGRVSLRRVLAAKSLKETQTTKSNTNPPAPEIPTQQPDHRCDSTTLNGKTEPVQDNLLLPPKTNSNIGEAVMLDIPKQPLQPQIRWADPPQIYRPTTLPFARAASLPPIYNFPTSMPPPIFSRAQSLNPTVSTSAAEDFKNSSQSQVAFFASRPRSPPNVYRAQRSSSVLDIIVQDGKRQHLRLARPERLRRMWRDDDKNVRFNGNSVFERGLKVKLGAMKSWPPLKSLATTSVVEEEDEGPVEDEQMEDVVLSSPEDTGSNESQEKRGVKRQRSETPSPPLSLIVERVEEESNDGEEDGGSLQRVGKHEAKVDEPMQGRVSPPGESSEEEEEVDDEDNEDGDADMDSPGGAPLERMRGRKRQINSFITPENRVISDEFKSTNASHACDYSDDEDLAEAADPAAGESADADAEVESSPAAQVKDKDGEDEVMVKTGNH